MCERDAALLFQLVRRTLLTVHTRLLVLETDAQRVLLCVLIVCRWAHYWICAFLSAGSRSNGSSSRSPASSGSKPQESGLAKSISKALDSGGSSIGIPSVDEIIKSTSTLSASPDSVGSNSPLSKHDKGNKHGKVTYC